MAGSVAYYFTGLAACINQAHFCHDSGNRFISTFRGHLGTPGYARFSATYAFAGGSPVVRFTVFDLDELSSFKRQFAGGQGCNNQESGITLGVRYSVKND